MLNVETGITPAVYPLAFLFMVFSPLSMAQLPCDTDGVAVTFRTTGGVVALRDVKAKELTGSNNADLAVPLTDSGMHAGYVSGGKIVIDSLDISAFPDSGISMAEVNRKAANVWEAEFPRGMYEFRNRSDLVVEVNATASGGVASHVGGGGSTVPLTVDSARITTNWYPGGGGRNSLRRVFGNLDFNYSNLQQLALAGIYQANVTVCVNIRGNL